MLNFKSACIAGLCVLVSSAAWAQSEDPVADEPVTDAAAVSEEIAAEESEEAATGGNFCKPMVDEAGEPVLDEAGEPVFDVIETPILDFNGEPATGADGTVMMQRCLLPGEEIKEAPTEQVEDEVEEEPASVFSPIMRLLDAGGPVIVILAILAVLALAVGLVKFGQFVYLGVGRNGFVHAVMDLVKTEKNAEAIGELDTHRNPVARVMAAAIRGRINDKMSDDLVREETTRIAQAQLDGLERGLSLLSLIATIAPLLGLLGTVLGMIEAFQQMETVGDRVEPAVLAGGIWEALLTTAAGLSVAIPAAVMFTWLQRSVDVEAQRMEDAATQTFTAPLYEAV